MNRTVVLAALGGALLQAGSLPAQRSDNTGFMAGLHAVPMGLGGVGTEAFEEEGMGLGLTLGYGFNERITLYATIDAGYIDYDPENPAAEGEDYESMTVDFGARMNFSHEGRRMRPYINAAITGITTSDDSELGTAFTSGSGVTVGGGFQWFFSRRWALDTAVQATAGAFTETSVDDDTEVFAEGQAFTHVRVHFGVIWHP